MIPFVDINSGEALILILIALVVIGPKRLPEYVAKLRAWVKQAQQMAENAKTQLKNEMGPEFQDVDWRQYDPRQYDPRKIVREALFDDPDADIGAELGLTERPASTGATAAGVVSVGAAGVGAAAMAGTGVGAEGVGAGAEETGQPLVPRSAVDNSYHPDRRTPFDVDAT